MQAVIEPKGLVQREFWVIHWDGITACLQERLFQVRANAEQWLKDVRLKGGDGYISERER